MVEIFPANILKCKTKDSMKILYFDIDKLFWTFENTSVKRNQERLE